MPNDARLLLIGRDQAAALLTPDAVLAAVRESFLLHAARAGRVFPLVREALPGNAVFGIKSGGVPGEGLLGFKAAGFWPANRSLDADAHQATIMLFDQATGRPQCLIDGNAITTARTAAAGALGLLALARPDSRRLCVFGTGVQAAAHIDYALRALPGLQEVRYMASNGRREPALESRFSARCDIGPAASTVSSAAMTGRPGTAADALGRGASPGAGPAAYAVRRADVIITATPARAPLFHADDVAPGTHINAVGADTRGKRELPEGLLQRARLWADDQPQASAIGELQWSADAAAAELGDLLASGRHARNNSPASDITIFDMTGLALQDLTVARMLMQRALENGTGTSIGWPW